MDLRSGARMVMAGLAVTVLSTGCSASVNDIDIASGVDATDVGERWNEFATANLLPLVGALTAAALFLIGIVFVARLAVYLPMWRDIPVTRATSKYSKLGGLILIILTVVAFVLAPAITTGSVPEWLIVAAIVLAIYGLIALSIGMATTPQLSAKVVTEQGTENLSWSIDLLTQMREMNTDDPKGRVGQPTASDLTEIIAIADRSGNGLTAFIATVVQVLFNVAPWNLQVTILDETSAVAILRRNGHVVDEEKLQLERGEPGSDQHRRTLTLAAAFGAMTVAKHYLDIKGFYQAKNWRSIGYLRIAESTSGRERKHYLKRALEEEESILVGYADVHDVYGDSTDAEQLAKFMDELEPMIDEAALLCGRPTVFHPIPRPYWHSVVLKGKTEPARLMLRLLSLYTNAAVNRAAAMRSTEPGVEVPHEADVQRRRIREVHACYIRALRAEPAGKRDDPHGLVARLRLDAALNYHVFSDPELSDDPRKVRRAAKKWFKEAEASPDIDIRFSYACYRAQRLNADSSPDEVKAIVDDVVKGIRCARFVYAEWMSRDPELRLLGHFQPVRDEVLAPIAQAWDIKRFESMKPGLAAHGVTEPAQLAVHARAADLRKPLELDGPAFRSLYDGATILNQARACSEGHLDETQMLRAVRYLLDEDGHTVPSLKVAFSDPLVDLVSDVSAAVFWVPDDVERERVAEFLGALAARLG
jgi:hypothetical protein